MDSFFWEYRLDRDYAFSSVEYRVASDTVTRDESLHWHNYYQIGLCTAGGGEFVFEGKSYLYRQGDIFLVDNLEKHCAYAVPGVETRFVFLLFFPQFVAGASSSRFDAEYLMPFWYNSAEFCNKIAGDTPQGRQLAEQMRELTAEFSEKRYGYRHSTAAKLRVILAELISLYGLEESGQAKLDRFLQLRPAIDYIGQHFREGITLADVAQQIFLSESRFRHLFKEMMHITFKEYVTNLRYLEAKRLLVQSERKIGDIAAEVGISNLYHFYEMFRHHEGMTPLAFRKKQAGSRF